MTLFPRCLFLVLLPVCWADFARIPLHFEANRGQFRKPARFVADGFLLAAAEARYAGGAPGLVAGVLQMNIRVPETSPSGPAIPIFIGCMDGPFGVEPSERVTISIR